MERNPFALNFGKVPKQYISREIKNAWDEPGHMVNETVLVKFDEALSHYVYKKMWAGTDGKK